MTQNELIKVITEIDKACDETAREILLEIYRNSIKDVKNLEYKVPMFVLDRLIATHKVEVDND